MKHFTKFLIGTLILSLTGALAFADDATKLLQLSNDYQSDEYRLSDADRAALQALEVRCEEITAKDPHGNVYHAVWGEHILARTHTVPPPGDSPNFTHELQLKNDKRIYRLFFMLPMPQYNSFYNKPFAENGKFYAICASENREKKFVANKNTLIELERD